MRREIVAEVIKYTGAFPYVDGLILGVTHAVGQVFVEHHDRYRGESQYSVAKSILVFMRVATGFSVWPLRFSACAEHVLRSVDSRWRSFISWSIWFPGGASKVG
jgi:undecaprenyl-phosphate 4-deoxy-4-formamido-L-arabinose transferase